MSTQTKSSSRPWLVFIGCCVLSLVGFGLIVNTPGLYFTVLGETLNVSRTQIALASSIMAIAGAVTMLFAGKVMKMLDSRILISVCIAGVAALFLAQSFFNAVCQFYISFALMGILYVIPISLAPSVLLANWFESKLGMVMGIALGLSGIGGTIFNPVVSWFITNLGWQTSYRLTALILVICILPFSLLVFKFRPDEAKGEQAYGHIVSAAVADDAQAAGELPGIESKKAYRTPTFVLLVLRRYEDSSEAGDYIQSKLALTPEQRELSPLLMPEYYRTIAEDTMKRPQLTQLYLVLRAEAIDPNHPAHEYYAQRGGRLRAQIGSYPWKLPPEYNTPQKIGLLSMCVGSAMEGLQSRWLGEPDIDFMSSWSQYEDILFPRPHWNGYR